MKNNKKILNGMGLGALVVLTTLVPLKACAAQPVIQIVEKPTVITAEVEEVDFSLYNQVNEPLEDAKKDMFKVNLVTKDGKVTRIDKEFQNGIKVLKGRTAISMFDMSETVPGIDLSWNQADRIATAKNEGNVLNYPINKRVMSRNGIVSELEVAATLDNKIGRTYLPLRSLMENLGYDVEFHEPTGTIDILEKGAKKLDHSGEVVSKPVDKPGKPAGISGKQSTVVKVYELAGYRTVTHSLPELEDLLDTKTTLKDQIKGKNIIKYEGKSTPTIYDNYKVMDGSHYYSNIGISRMYLSLPEKVGQRTSIFLDETVFADSYVDPSHGDNPRFEQMQTYAFEDTEGNLYISDGHGTANSSDIYTGKTMKYVYEVSSRYKVVIKVVLPNPQPIK